MPVLARDRGASMHLIATRAGISRATLLRLFPTRRELLEAVSARILDGCEAVLDCIDGPPPGSGEAFGSLLAGVARFAQLWSLVYVEPEILGDPAAAERAADIMTRLDVFFARLQDDGVVRTDMPPRWLAATFCGLAEAAWELNLGGYMGALQAPDYVSAVLLGDRLSQPGQGVAAGFAHSSRTPRTTT